MLYDRLLPPGLSYVIVHPEMNTPGDWPSRVADYGAFIDPDHCRFVRDQGIQVIGWRSVRDALRGAGMATL